MGSKVTVYLVIGIVIGSMLGVGGSYGIFTSQINVIQGKLAESEKNYQTLSSSYQILNTEKTDLQKKYSDLAAQKNELQQSYQNLQTKNAETESEYAALQGQYSALQTSYDAVSKESSQRLTYLQQLSSNVTNLYDIFKSYSIPEAFQRTLNDAEVRKTSSVMTTLAIEHADTWTARDRIYNYIVNNINYRYDTDYPYISSWRYVTYNGTETWVEFKISTIQDFVQTPEFTLDKKQGDCDCQAVLEYAMITYYYRYIYGTTYLTYIAKIDFSDGTGHAAVFIPIQGGQLCILDTAGKYRTTTQSGATTSKNPLTELNGYQSSWSTHGIITKMTLYRIDTSNGSYYKDAEGTLAEIGNYLSSS